MYAAFVCMPGLALRRVPAAVALTVLLASAAASAWPGAAAAIHAERPAPVAETPVADAAETELLDELPSGLQLVATVLPGLPNTDEPRRLRVALVRAGRALPWACAGEALLDARFVGPDAAPAAVVVTRTQQLELVTLDGSRRLPLAAAVTAPLDVAPDRRRLVYAAGPMPEFEVWRLDLPPLTAGRLPAVAPAARALTETMAPAWSPTWSADGRRVAFVSARSGVPALFQVAANGGRPRPWTNRGLPHAAGVARAGLTPFPTGPGRALWGGGLFIFEHEGAVHALTAAGELAWSRPQSGAPRWRVRGAVVVVQDRAAGGEQVVPLAAGEGRP